MAKFQAKIGQALAAAFEPVSLQETKTPLFGGRKPESDNASDVERGVIDRTSTGLVYNEPADEAKDRRTE